MKISQLLDRKGRAVRTVKPTASIHEAMVQMSSASIGSLMVVDEEGHVAGIITERDCVRAAAENAEGLGQRVVSDQMSRDLVVATLDDDLASVARKMNDRNCRHVPVMSEGRLCGMISSRDVLLESYRETSEELEHLHNYIHGGPEA